jgi:HPt (histidine-containing phosphotransfer) domain-containing protein
MRSNYVAMVLYAVALGGCATMDVGAGIGTEARVAVARGPAARESVLLLGDALACMLDEGAPPARCEAIAQVAAVPVAALVQGDSRAIEHLSEYAVRRARSERMPLAQQTVLVRWFDTAAGAVREAAAARAGADGSSVAACAERFQGHPPLADLEMASWRDSAAVRQRGQWQVLFESIPEAGEFAPDIEATALLVLAHRVETAARARPELRDDAARTVGDLAAALGTPADGVNEPGSSRAARGAAGDSATILASTRVRLAARLATIAPTVSIPSLRRAAERAAQRATDPTR